MAVGLLVFRESAFDPAEPEFQCLTAGALTAGILSAVRVSRHDLAVVIVTVFGLSRVGLAESRGWLLAVSGFLFAAGLYLASLVFDLLGRRGVRFGKFLILGPLMGGLYLALTPMVEFYDLTTNGVLRTLMSRVLMGLLIGDGVGFGVEVVELFFRGDRPAPADPGSSGPV
jgi:hypothetical protein